MDVKIEKSWKKILTSIFATPDFANLVAFVKQEYKTQKCFPPAKLIFEAFNQCPFDKLKVVILGQDPYHGMGQAHGLCFSVSDGIAHPPSLKNIFLELEKDVKKKYPKTGNLTLWAKQGVLLLNATLTVCAHKAGSHQGKGWEDFTDKTIQMISNKKEKIIFLLWGNYAKQKKKFIDTSKHKILESGHPSPFSANKGYWFGNKHFSKCNEYLKSQGKTPITW